MTFSAQMTSQDCYEVARRKTTIITSQRKLHRLLKAISEKERYAALYQSKFMCERYDSEIERSGFTPGCRSSDTTTRTRSGTPGCGFCLRF
jgi:hypothetical protein